MNPLAAASQTPAVSQSKLGRRAVQVVLGSLFVALCAHISIPLWFTPVPLTLENFAVLLLGLFLEPGVAASAMGLYLLEGMAGLPVLSPVGAGGLLHVFGPSGGYLMAYPAAAAITAYLRRRMGRSFAGLAAASAVGDALILLSGAAWFEILTGRAAATVLLLTITPFLAGDTLKVMASAAIASGTRRWRHS